MLPFGCEHLEIKRGADRITGDNPLGARGAASEISKLRGISSGPVSDPYPGHALSQTDS
jgi:hypothetical protein